MNEKLSALLDGELSDAELQDAPRNWRGTGSAGGERYYLARDNASEVERTAGVGLADRSPPNCQAAAAGRNAAATRRLARRPRYAAGSR